MLGLDNAAVRRLGSAVVQIPEKSGLPSAIRGGGADMFTLPSAVCGTPAVGYFNHCADKCVDETCAISVTKATAMNGLQRRLILDIARMIHQPMQSETIRRLVRIWARGPKEYANGI